MNCRNRTNSEHSKCQNVVFFILILTLLSGCQSRSSFAPVSSVGIKNIQQGRYHVVHKGDTLYSIAFRHGLDYRELAKSNGVAKPYTIFIGQRLQLSNKKVQRIQKTKRIKRRQKTVAKSPKNKSVDSSSSKSQYSKIKWRWPVKGEVIRKYSLTGKINKGVDIRGKLGESVHNAADGVVVYAGGGIRGYGKLVIVKHDDHFLSAYGHNRVILVKEGDKVKGGQVVAEIGSSEPDREMLHFEIRKDGKPEDPLIYLPNRRGKL